IFLCMSKVYLILNYLFCKSLAKFAKCQSDEKCIRLDKCPHILDILRQDYKMTSEQRNLMTQKQCDLDNQSISHLQRIYVCCPEPGNVLPDVDTCGHRPPVGRIFGGTKSQMSEFPWMAMLLYNRGQENGLPLCAGSLINTRYVLTADHCLVTWQLIESGTVVTSVRLGEWNTSSNPDCVTQLNGRTHCSASYLELDVEQRTVHMGYQIGSKSHQNDIALLRMRQPVRYTTEIKPICVMSSIHQLWNSFGENFSFEIAGWGSTDKQKSSSILMKSSIENRKPHLCRKRFKNWTESQLCAGGLEGKDTCAGDSGSPLMATINVGAEAYVYLAGITSYGPTPCGFPGWPGVYTRTAAFIDWIQLNLRA
ncbi:hypothetical protein KR032_007846, partial [Drosophila birchii]